MQNFCIMMPVSLLLLQQVIASLAEEEEEEEEEKKDDENCVLPGCQFAALPMLLGNVDILVWCRQHLNMTSRCSKACKTHS